MFKTVVLAALGFAAVSAQFLNFDERFLQNVTAVSAACSATATADTGCATAGFCCAAYTKTGTAVTTPAAGLCVPTDFVGQNLTIAGTTYSFGKCVANVTTTTAVTRVACTSDDSCSIGQCCANATLVAGLATANGTATRRFCTDGTASSPFQATYTATSWLASYTSRVNLGQCVPKAAPVETFGAYIKASVMMVVAVLSVALF